MMELRVSCDAKSGEVSIYDFTVDLTIIANMIENGQLAGKQPSHASPASITWNLLLYTPVVEASHPHSIFYYSPNDNGDGWNTPVFDSTWRSLIAAHDEARRLRANWPGHLFAVLPIGKLPLRTRS